jgi:hypothetical protein
VLQSVLKWGTPEQRASLVAEAAPELPALAKDAYGTHLVRKMLDTAGKPELALLAKALKARTNMRLRVASHAHAVFG